MTPLRFIHISDTHVGDTPSHRLYDRNTHACALRLAAVLRELPFVPDFIINTGDVSANGSEASYRLTAEIFSNLPAPMYYAGGNHDQPAIMLRTLSFGPLTRLGGDSRLFYEFQVKGIRCIVLDARGPDSIDPHGLLDDAQRAYLGREAGRDETPLLIFIHFPALPPGAPWFDANMLLFDGDRFHAALLPLRSRLRGVFLGHLHRPLHTIKDGILYSAAGSSFRQFDVLPEQPMVTFDPFTPPQYSIVTVDGSQTTITQCTVPPPRETPGSQEERSME